MCITSNLRHRSDAAVWKCFRSQHIYWLAMQYSKITDMSVLVQMWADVWWYNNLFLQLYDMFKLHCLQLSRRRWSQATYLTILWDILVVWMLNFCQKMFQCLHHQFTTSHKHSHEWYASEEKLQLVNSVSSISAKSFHFNSLTCYFCIWANVLYWKKIKIK